MTISTTASTVTAAGNGATVSFAFNFVYDSAANIQVTFTDANSNATVLVQGSQYTLSLNPPAAGQVWGVGGTVAYPLSGPPIPAGTYLTITRVLPLTQLVTLANQGAFYPQVVEKALDLLEMQIQEVEEQVGRALLFNPADRGPFAPLPIAAVRAGKILGFDSTGNPGVFSALPFGSVSSAMAPVVEAATTQGAVALLNYQGAQAGATVRLLTAKLGDIVSVKDFGATGDGIADDTAAFNAALATMRGGGALRIPAGTYKLTSKITHTFTSATASLTIVGDGADVTNLVWPGGQGLQIDYLGPFNSCAISGMSFLTGTTATGEAIILNQTLTSWPQAAIGAFSTISDVTIRGSDGYTVVNYWEIAIASNGVSNIDFLNVIVFGPAATLGTGFLVQGTSTLPPVAFSFSMCTFNYVLNAIQYGDFVQGINMSQCNITGGVNGIVALATSTNLDQLAVTACQINVSGSAINLQQGIVSTSLIGNLFTNFDSDNVSIVQMVNAGIFQIVGNSIYSLNDAQTNVNGIAILSSSSNGIITGNMFFRLNTGVFLAPGTAGVNVQSNAYASNVTTAVNDEGSGNTIGGGSS